jgi:hypothetical protein
LEGIAIEDVGIFYGHLYYFTSISYVIRVVGFSVKQNIKTGENIPITTELPNGRNIPIPNGHTLYQNLPKLGFLV